MKRFEEDDLDTLLTKYCKQNMWKNEEEIEPIADVIAKVDKRFHIIRNDKVKGNGSPKRTMIPFYSHENDIFADYDAAKNLFNEGEDPEESDIGILSIITRPNDKESATRTDEILVDVFKEFKTCICKFITTREVIKLFNHKNMDGARQPIIGINVFNKVFMDMFEKSFCRLMNGYSKTQPFRRNLLYVYSSNNPTKNMDRIIIELISNLNDKFVILLSEAVHDFLDSNPVNFPGYRIIDNLMKEFHKMSKSEYDEAFSNADDYMFRFSSKICDIAYDRFDIDDMMKEFDNIAEKYFRYTELWKQVDTAREYMKDALEYIRTIFGEDFLSIDKRKFFYSYEMDVESYHPSIDKLNSYIDLPDKLEYVPKRNLRDMSSIWQ